MAAWLGSYRHFGARAATAGVSRGYLGAASVPTPTPDSRFTRVRYRRTLTARALAPVVAAAVLLPTAACQTNAGAAAFVGNSKISTADLSSFAQRSEQVLASGGGQGATTAAVQRNDLGLLITEKLLDRVAAQRKVSVSDSDVRVFQSQQLAANGAQITPQLTAQGIGASDQTLVFRVQLLYNRIAATLGGGSTTQQNDPTLPLLVQESKRAGVRVNPRFGTWNAEQLAVAASGDDLSRPAGSPGQPIAP